MKVRSEVQMITLPLCMSISFSSASASNFRNIISLQSAYILCLDQVIYVDILWEINSKHAEFKTNNLKDSGVLRSDAV
jgi:hypothetical protein